MKAVIKEKDAKLAEKDVQLAEKDIQLGELQKFSDFTALCLENSREEQPRRDKDIEQR